MFVLLIALCRQCRFVFGSRASRFSHLLEPHTNKNGTLVALSLHNDVRSICQELEERKCAPPPPGPSRRAKSMSTAWGSAPSFKRCWWSWSPRESGLNSFISIWKTSPSNSSRRIGLGWCQFWRTVRVTWSPNLSSLVSTWRRNTKRSCLQMTLTGKFARGWPSRDSLRFCLCLQAYWGGEKEGGLSGIKKKRIEKRIPQVRGGDD